MEQVVEITSPLPEIACHMESHSVTCHMPTVTFPPLPQPKLVLDSATPEGCKAELTWWWLHPKIVYPPKTVRSPISEIFNPAVSWPGIEPRAKSRESDVLTTTPPSHHTLVAPIHGRMARLS